MIYLLIVSLIWAFSFGLIKGNLTGLDSNFVAFIRLLISFIFFLPFIKIKKYSFNIRMRLILNGLIQYGIMYSAYIYSYQFLKAYEVALFTIFTPIYVTLINDLYQKKFNPSFLITAIISVVGAGIIVFEQLSNSQLIIGFLIVQISNVAFGFGQVAYKITLNKIDHSKDHELFSWLFLGAILFTGFLSLLTVDFSNLQVNSEQVFTLLYLGLIASGIGFFLWNYGARRTNTGALAIFNNLKIPLAIAVSFLFFGESTNLTGLLIGGIIVLGSLIINQYILSKNLNNQK
jgi:drug/metabolite transporter (DMT)-like permease